jgi:hypothetical protein
MELVLFGLYMIPTIIAAIRNHNNAVALGVVNFFLGWTFIGWVLCLAWACTNNVQRM